jgi:hypothetical protein
LMASGIRRRPRPAPWRPLRGELPTRDRAGEGPSR